MSLITEMPGVALLCLVSVRIAFFLAVLRGTGRGNDGRIDDGAFLQNKAALGEKLIDL